MLWGILVAVLGSLAGWFLAPIVASAGLLAWGIGSAGPIAGSMAAAFQASVGNVIAGSVFAFCQSIAMGGLSAFGYAVGGVVGGAISLLGGWLSGLF